MTAAISYAAHDLQILAALEPRHFWFRSRRRIILDALRRWFPDARSYLEVGCGTGYVVRGIRARFPQWRVLASDALAEDAGVLRIDAMHIPFASAFDIIGAYDVLEHIEDDRGALAQFRSAVRPGGGVLLTVPQHAWLWSPADTYAHHHRRYRRKDLLALLRESGFEILASTSFNTLNLPLLFLRNQVLRATQRDPDASLPAPSVNWLLERSMTIDRMLIRAGLRLPAGGSLLVAARRRE